MDYYKKKKVKNLFLLVLFVLGIYLQVQGHKIVGYKGLFIQILSLGLLILILYIYNRRHKA
ncbi:MAG: hypothetical protein Q4E36_00400 [Bacillota bacterium]|nr:hypothetical protein [Bacillota bacterium]